MTPLLRGLVALVFIGAAVASTAQVGTGVKKEDELRQVILDRQLFYHPVILAVGSGNSPSFEQRFCLLPIWDHISDKPMERRAVIRMPMMAKLVHDHIVNARSRFLH